MSIMKSTPARYLEKFPPPDHFLALGMVYGARSEEGRWAVVADRWVMICERTEDALPPMEHDNRGVVATCLRTDHTRLGTIGIKALRELCGHWEESCGACDGFGYIEHECDCCYCAQSGDETCVVCEGEGKRLPRRYGWIEGCAVNLAIVAKALAVLPGHEALTLFGSHDRLSHDRREPQPHFTVLHIHVAGIRVMIMGLKEVHDDDAPRITLNAEIAA